METLERLLACLGPLLELLSAVSNARDEFLLVREERRQLRGRATNDLFVCLDRVAVAFNGRTEPLRIQLRAGRAGPASPVFTTERRWERLRIGDCRAALANLRQQVLAGEARGAWRLGCERCRPTMIRNPFSARFARDSVTSLRLRYRTRAGGESTSSQERTCNHHPKERSPRAEPAAVRNPIRCRVDLRRCPGVASVHGTGLLF